MNNEIVKYESMTGQEVQLSPDIVRQYLVNGDSKLITDQEISMFLALCKYQQLNPFLREIYLVKYGSKNPATMVTGKETFLKRAAKNPKYEGHKTGISEDGKVAWAEVYIQGYQVPIRCEVDYDEYVGTKDEYTGGKPSGKKVPNKMWASKPKTMLKKVALVQALREAFPADFGGLYSQEEINTVDMAALNVTPIREPQSNSQKSQDNSGSNQKEKEGDSTITRINYVRGAFTANKAIVEQVLKVHELQPDKTLEPELDKMSDEAYLKLVHDIEFALNKAEE